MEHNYSEVPFEDLGSDVFASEFNTSQQSNHFVKLSDINKPLIVIQKDSSLDPCLSVKKKQLFGKNILSMGYPTETCTLNDTPPSIGVSVSHLQPTVSSYEIPREEICMNEEHGNFSESTGIVVENYDPLIIDDDEVQIHDYVMTELRDGDQGLEADNQAQDYERDKEIEEITRLINDGEGQPSFIALPSAKTRNPPYLIKNVTKIYTKNEEPLKFQLKNAKPCDIVCISMRFTEEKHKNSPVIACPLHRKDLQQNDTSSSNFLCSTAFNDNWSYKLVFDHPTAHVTLDADNMDAFGNFFFFVTVRCLNSCHKANGKKVELIFKLMDPDKNSVIEEIHFDIRACKNVKRDYKEAFQEEENSVEKRRMILKPESFICQDKAHDEPSCQEEAKKSNEVRVQMIRPLEEESAPESEKETYVKCVPVKAEVPPKPRFFLVMLPNVEKEKNVLETVRLLGGKVMSLESVFPVEAPEEENDP